MDEILLVILIGILGVSLVLLTAFSVIVVIQVTEYVSKKVPKKVNKEHQDG